MGSFSIETLLFLFGILQVSYGVKFLLTVPKEAYYDADLVASVSAFGLVPGQKETVTLEYRGQKDASKILNSTTLVFTADSSQTWKVVFPWEHIQQIDETGVMLVMTSGQHEERKTLTFTQNFGYIFIQTDKPIYTPLQTVKFRVIAVDEYQRLAKYVIRIDIKNHKQIVVDRMRYTAEEAFKAKEFELPKETPPGEWSITANFEGVDNAPGAIHRVTFEVKEYVLPRFFSTISVDPDVITRGTKWITVNVTSRYVYDRPVIGSIEMKLGIWQQNVTTMLPVNYTQPLVNGQMVKDISVGNLFPNNVPFTRNNRLYVKATVTESASLESYTYEDTSTFIAHPYYLVDFKSSKKYFRPGFPYTFQAQVTAQSGRPASWVSLYVVSMFYDNNDQYIGGNSSYTKLDQFGEMKKDFDIPEEAYQTKFSAIVVDPKVPEFERYELKVTKLDSSNNEYIHISVAAPIKKNKGIDLLLRYTKPGRSVTRANVMQDNITVLVLAKGHIIFSTTSVRNSEGRSMLQLPSRLYAEITPSMRIIAYYHVQSNTSEFVVDSLLVDTPDACLEEIFLTPPQGASRGLYKPKDRFVLEVDGSPDMNVGFVAVDKAVLILNDKQTLTRNLMFSQLGSHDKGLGSGDGSSVDEIFQNSGLYFIPMDLDTPFVARTESVNSGGLWYINAQRTRSKGGSTRQVDQTEETLQAIIPLLAAPPQTVRNYFPESWLFEERKLPKSGKLDLNLTLPDSITTWSFLAVGVSSNRGICVSEPLEQKVHKLFFADVRLPYKATRLEEVKVKIAVYNYQTYAIEVKVIVTGSEGLCFSANTVRGNTKNSTSFTLRIEAMQAKGETVKVIPLRNGDLILKVDVENQHEKDVVEKKLHVIAEGQRVKKSITFVLDPEAKHATFRPSKKNKTTLFESSTINNTFDLKTKEQQTTIDLALPSNVIRGTESCRIFAFGDLMGDIITHAVVESRNLIDTPLLDAEEVLGDLAPTVHALLSAKRFGLMDENLKERGHKFVRRGITRLLKFRLDNYSFALTPKSKSSSWLTAFALKTLCHANALIFIDREQLINHGFDWLLHQVKSDGTLNEQDWRITKSVTEYSIMLSAEVLIAIMECKKSDLESHLVLQGYLSGYLESTLHQIKDPMVLAKVTYALMLFDPTTEEYQDAVKRLNFMKKKNKQGHCYWSKVEETDESKRMPIWFHREPKASAIEATAYALLVFLKQGGTNIDAIADWLVGQRNYNGAFVGAMDSTAAIQALSEYSLQKHGHEVDLHCNVSSDRLEEYFYSFKFTDENAIHRESLHNVPVGQVLDVLTKGHGLGQMQVNVEYNIPIDKNQHCPFLITINVKKTMVNWSANMHSNPLCTSCGIGCPKPVNTTKDPLPLVLSDVVTANPVAAKMRIKVSKPVTKGDGKQGRLTRKPNTRDKTKGQRRTTKRLRSGERNRTRKPARAHANRRLPRFVDLNPVASKKSICVHVCFQHINQGRSGPIEARIEMLTGYQPVMVDIEKIEDMPNVKHVEYDSIQEVLKVQFTEISCTEKTCVAFRAIDEGEVGRLTPANVEVIQIGTATPQCVMEYHSIADDESLQVYCADFSHRNRGECRCYSGICSRCKPEYKDELDLDTVKVMACKKPVAYQLQIANVTNMGNWVEIKSRVVTLNKTGTDNITSGSIIKMMTPTSCWCPVRQYTNSSEKFYMLSPDVEKLVDRNGNYVYNYLLDEQSVILKVAEPGMTPVPELSVPHFYLQQALSTSNKCLK